MSGRKIPAWSVVKAMSVPMVIPGGGGREAGRQVDRSRDRSEDDLHGRHAPPARELAAHLEVDQRAMLDDPDDEY